jgi:SNF2 family DNA or RNA helicase
LGRRLAEAAGPDVLVHLLTGTPLTNRPRDLFPLLQLARHPMARSFLSFAKRYCAAVHNGYGWDTSGASNLDELRVQLHGLMLRRSKDDVLDLPPKVRTWLLVDVPEGTARRESRRVLDLMLEGQRNAGDGSAGGAAEPRTVRSAAAAGTAAKRSGVVVPGGRRDGARVRLLGELARARRKLALAKSKHTIDLVQNAVQQGEKVLVFSCFAGPIEAIAAHFGAAARMLTGETPASTRQDIVDAFQTNDDVRVLVANIVVGGIGHNLTAARQVVFNDLDWVPAQHWQAEDRAYRIGQTGTVNVSYMVGAGTIDEFVARVLESKAALVGALVEGAEFPADVLTSLEALVASFSPELENPQAGQAGEDAVDRLLREVARGFEQKSLIAAQARARSGLAADAIARLAEVLAGTPAARYRVRSGRSADVWYTLDVDGPDVICECPGFSYRGNCTHARTLKSALQTGVLPEGFIKSE